MSPYRYSSLLPGPDSIRLLHLVPHEDKTAPIQCQLVNYSLQESGGGTHQYEALSYVWGDPKETLPISIDKHDLPVTENLHAALSRLRHRFIVRIIWVDAICINQADRQEKEHQIKSMAKIYGQANRVIVWLGEAADDSDRALEYIRIAASKKPTNSSNNETTQQAILALLQRAWFRRIWVLQEVAAARDVLIMSGSMVIDGYAFCLGVTSLELSYTAYPELQSLIRSVTYLIRGAISRPKYATTRSGSASLDILPLGELIDMYHTHEATIRLDKVYALLGMSSDNPGAASLSPDYNVSWEELFQRLVKFLLYEEVSVETWGDREMAVIKTKGCILGRVSWVKSDTTRDDRQSINIIFKNAPRYLGDKREWSAFWILPTSAKHIREGDLLCLLQGASKPTIIRLCKDHFAIITIASAPMKDTGIESGHIKWSELLRLIKAFPHNFVLVWDWEKPPGKVQYRGEYEALIKTNSQVPEHSKAKWEDYFDKAARLWSVAQILKHLGEHKEAEERVREAIQCYKLTSIANLASTYSSQGRWKEAEELFVQVMETRKTKLGANHSTTLTSMANLASTYWKQGRWDEAEELFVQVMETRKTKLGADHLDTLTSMANLASTYRKQGRWDEAEELFVQVIKTRKTKLGANHPTTLTSMANLASTYRKQSRWKEAEKLQVQVMKTRKRVLGDEHADTLISMVDLASTFWIQGRWKKAEELEVQVMETSKAKLGADHPTTLTSMNNLAFTWKGHGRDTEALKLMEECVTARIRIFGTNHPDTLSSCRVLLEWQTKELEIGA
ncbi:uncharacterized protein PAC_19813 [Phialocephala subalpina]|uniref:Heterokaryon incompatibility domain-containing protein n=1 Tax=Phialocephala subalpina TaxID=576137 RepID=A0A1L7XXW5_9HELO|nr:uncharacterized protein PAC_19813 [Phialocephala subalpina]